MSLLRSVICSQALLRVVYIIILDPGFGHSKVRVQNFKIRFLRGVGIKGTLLVLTRITETS